MRECGACLLELRPSRRVASRLPMPKCTPALAARSTYVHHCAPAVRTATHGHTTIAHHTTPIHPPTARNPRRRTQGDASAIRTTTTLPPTSRHASHASFFLSFFLFCCFSVPVCCIFSSFFLSVSSVSVEFLLHFCRISVTSPDFCCVSVAFLLHSCYISVASAAGALPRCRQQRPRWSSC